MTTSISPGVYNLDYYSSSAVAVYIGDIWIDEITSISYSVNEPKYPIYGYADALYRAIGKGQVSIQGQFTINFKEAGYLWLVLNEYKKLTKNQDKLTPFVSSSSATKNNIERIVNNDNVSYEDRVTILKSGLFEYQSLAGFPGGGRDTNANNSLGEAEDIFEQFENKVWGKESTKDFNQYLNTDESHRRATSPELNGFDIYISYGDFVDSDRSNHTIRKIENVHLVGMGQEVSINNAEPIQEMYTFIARNMV